ncbi:MAG: VanW family protein [Polyangiaceae bacterium]
MPPSLRLNRARGASLVLVAVCAGLGIGFLLVPRAPGPADPKEPAPEVRLLGEKLELDDDAPKRALERVRRFAAGKFVLDAGDGKKRELSFGRLGAEIDKVRVSQLVRDCRDATSPLRMARRSQGITTPVALPVPIVLDTEPVTRELLRVKDELDRLPVDARLDLEKRALLPETPGRLLDVDSTIQAIRSAIERGESSVTAVFEARKPKRSAAELGDVKFDAVLGWFETKYNRGEKYQARTFNLRLAASKLDGTVLLPGEVFDFNEVVGARDEANGYKVAPVIAEGELVDGIGGGTCQISGTLHGAAFFSGLDIVERYPHTRPSSYIKMGLDATVVFPTINFRVKNGFDFPVVLHETVKNGAVRAEVLGPRRARTVTLIRRIDSAIPYEEVERDDPNLPEGVRVLSQRGVAGFKLHRYRIVREGEHAVRERWSDVYPPTTQIVKVGRGNMPKDSIATKHDEHPEYLADELLVMTQGVDVGANDGEAAQADMSESRDPGKFGEPRWTEKAGMPYFDQAGDSHAQEGGEPDKAAKKASEPSAPAEPGKGDKGDKGDKGKKKKKKKKSASPEVR